MEHEHPVPPADDHLLKHLVDQHAGDIDNNGLGDALVSGSRELRRYHDSIHAGAARGVYRFRYYLHSTDRESLYDHLTDPPRPFGGQPGDPPLPARIARKIADENPFYQVTVECEYDTATGEVTLVKATL